MGKFNLFLVLLNRMDKLTSFDNRPSIVALQRVEQDILNLLDVASKACTELSKTGNESKSTLDQLSREYLTYVKNIREGLETQVQRITVDVPYQNSIYGSKKDAEISYMTVQVVHNQLKDLSNYLEDKSPPIVPKSNQELDLFPQVKEEEMEFIEIS